MGVGFIKGRIGSDRSQALLDLCFKEARSGSRGPIFILVPEKYTFEMEKKLSIRLLKDRDPNLRIRVVSMSTLANMVFTKVGGLKEKKLTSSARGMMTYRAIEAVSKDLKTLRVPQDSTGLVDIVKDALIELKQNKIGLEDLEEMVLRTDDHALKAKLEDIGLIYSSYEKLMEEDYIDTEDWIQLLSKKLATYEEIKEATIFIDEFTGFTPVQYDLIEVLIALSKNTYISLLLDLKSRIEVKTVFSKTHITYQRLIDICNRHNLKRLEDIEVSSQDYYSSPDLAYLEKNINFYRAKPFDEESNSIELIEFENIYKEVEYVAAKIVELVNDKGYRYREITVATRALDTYAYLVRAIFKDYKLNYFLDQKLEAKTNPILVLLTSILNMKKENYSYNSVFNYLKSGLVGIDHEEVSLLENYVIANGIRGSKWFEDWDMPLIHNIEDDSEPDNTYINDIRVRVMEPIENLHKKLKGKNRLREISAYLYQFALEIGLPDRINDLIEDFKAQENHYKAKEYSQVWNIFVNVLDEMVEFLGDESIGLERYIRLMEAELSGFELGIIPPSSDQVFVTSVDRMKNPDTKVLILMGVNEGVFPKTIGDQTLISDREKEKLGQMGIRFDSDVKSKTYDEVFLVYRAMGIARERLIISHPISSFKGDSLKMSSLIKKIMKIFPSLKMVNFLDSDLDPSHIYDQQVGLEEKKKAENMLASSQNYDNRVPNLSLYQARVLYGKGVFSVSKLESYAACPFSYFMNYGLAAKERPINEFSPMDSGIYSHKILDEFSKSLVKKGLTWKDLDKEYIDLSVNQISEGLVRSRAGYILDSSDKYRYLYSRLNKSLVDSIDNMSKQVKKGNFKPSGFELSFGFNSTYPPLNLDLDGSRNVNIIGKIDRVDTCIDGEREFVRVIDYKSSGKEIDLTSLYGGLKLQLFMYMNAVLNADKTGRMEPAAVLYSSFSNKDLDMSGLADGLGLSEEELDKRLLKENKFSGLIVNDQDIISHMDNDLEAGRSSDILKLELKKDGTIYESRTTSMSPGEFDTVRTFVMNKSKEICQEIYDGKIDISPYRKGASTACTYCDYRSVCQFDPSIKTNSYRDIELPLADKPKAGKEDSDEKNKPKKDKAGRYSDIVEVLDKRNKEGGVTSGN